MLIRRVIIAIGVATLFGSTVGLTAPLQVIGSYPIPDGGRAASAIDLPGTRVALRAFGAPYNYYEFDCALLQFVNPQYFDHPDIETDKIGWICWAGSGTNLGLEFANDGLVGIGSRSTGQVLFDFAIGDEVPFIYSGIADGTEIMIAILEYYGLTHFLNLSQPDLLGTVTWPTDYQTPDDWIMDFEGDYTNWHGLHSYCYNSLSQTLFMPISHQGLVYWCQIDLSSGFNYSSGAISCGTKPQYVIQSTDGTAVYVFDDEANEVFTINPLTRQITSTVQFESNSILGKTVYHQGYLYFPLDVLPLTQYTERIVRLNPSTGNTIDATSSGRVITDLDAYGSSIYVLQHDLEHNCHLLEFRASDLQLLDDIVVGDRNTTRMLVDTPSGRLTVWDDTNESLIVIQL